MGTIASAEDAVHYLTWTFFFRRVLLNPGYYGVHDSSTLAIQEHLLKLVNGVIHDLSLAGCISAGDRVRKGSLDQAAAAFDLIRVSTVALRRGNCFHAHLGASLRSTTLITPSLKPVHSSSGCEQHMIETRR